VHRRQSTFGMSCAMKGGVGSFTVSLAGGVKVSALVAVNAIWRRPSSPNRADLWGKMRGSCRRGVRRHCELLAGTGPGRWIPPGRKHDARRRLPPNPDWTR